MTLLFISLIQLFCNFFAYFYFDFLIPNLWAINTHPTSMPLFFLNSSIIFIHYLFGLGFALVFFLFSLTNFFYKKKVNLIILNLLFLCLLFFISPEIFAPIFLLEYSSPLLLRIFAIFIPTLFFIAYKLSFYWPKKIKIKKLEQYSQKNLLEFTKQEAPIFTKNLSIHSPKKISKHKSDLSYQSLMETFYFSDKKREKKIIQKNPSETYFSEIVIQLEKKLLEFKIQGKIINILKGPVVDTFELELGPGVKISRLTSISEDLGLALYGIPIRVVYPLQGKNTVGIEIPRRPRQSIYLEDLVSTVREELFHEKENPNIKKEISLLIGTDSFGPPVLKDLSSMPHLLVAGATGAGKSVFINSLLTSLLLHKSPEQINFILIDPKQLELALYANLPHLAHPVVHSPDEAYILLLWCVEEMERRYTLMKENGVRNLQGLNQKQEYNLPYIVVVIDEFADLILTKRGKDIEILVCKLAAKARASGIHLIVATQRPSVDVITGLIKANFPTRISFKVVSSVDSRTILNTSGAEKLLGKGDMLLKHGIELQRIHSAFITEDEIEHIVEYILSLELPLAFNDSITSFVEENMAIEENSSKNKDSVQQNSQQDPLFQEATNLVTQSQSASASFLQRRLKIGYNRAANLLDELEDKGVVGPAIHGQKTREVLFK